MLPLSSFKWIDQSVPYNRVDLWSGAAAAHGQLISHLSQTAGIRYRGSSPSIWKSFRLIEASFVDNLGSRRKRKGKGNWGHLTGQDAFMWTGPSSLSLSPPTLILRFSSFSHSSILWGMLSASLAVLTLCARVKPRRPLVPRRPWTPAATRNTLYLAVHTLPGNITNNHHSSRDVCVYAVREEKI